MIEEDVRKTGPVGLRYNSDRGLNNKDSDPLAAIKYKSGTNIKGNINAFDSKPKESVGQELVNLGVGGSQYDKNLTSMEQAYDLNEFRAQSQPWYDQIANGALKMVTTAATTFIDGTVGTLYGLGTGIYNRVNDPETGFWRGMWDNAVTNAMADVNDKMEEVAHNYRTKWEEDASVFERMFSSAGAANFWGDDILKNAGFTIGAAASIYATASAGAWLKGLGAIGKLGRGAGLLAKTAEGLQPTNVGKIVSWLVKTFVSTQGEASIEALNSTRESLKAMDAEIAAMRQEGSQNAILEFQEDVANGMSVADAKAKYEATMEGLEKDLAAYQDHMQQELTDAGNMIYAANIAALSVSNNLTLGSLIRGGYNTSESLLRQAVKTAGGKPINSAEEAGKALLKGELKFDVPKVNNAVAKTVGHWALTSTQEALEEGVQNLASNTGQIVASARTHKWAKDQSMLNNLINADAEEDLVNYSKALGKAYEEQFGKINSPGWTEVVAGFLTGAMGTVSAHRNEAGNIRPTWQGGLKESWETINGNRKAVSEVANRVNKALSSNKFNERAKHAVEQIAIKKEQDAALERGDIQAFKNLEIQQLLSDAVFFRDLGMLDDYLAMYKSMAADVSDEDVAELKAAVKNESGEKGALEFKPDDEIKQLYRDKAQSTLDKINKALENYEQLEKEYEGKFSDETKRDALMEISYRNTLYQDTLRRKDDIQKEIDDLENKKRTPLEDVQLEQKKKALEQLEKQEESLKKTLEEWQKDPKKLQKIVEDHNAKRQKQELYKKAEEAIAKYKTANTLKDAVDVYVNSPNDTREAVLNQAISQSDGETKAKLEQLKNYIGDVSSLEHLIDDRFPVNLEEASTENLLNLSKNKTFHDLLNSIVEEMLEDDSPVLTRDNLKDKLKSKLDEIQGRADEAKEKAHGVTIDDSGNMDFTAAYDEGVVSDDDFDSILDDVDTGASHKEIKKGSKAEEVADAAQEAKEYDNIINDLNYFIDSLDKVDELKKAGARKGKETPSKKKTKSGKSEVEIIEDEDEGESESFDDSSEEEEDEDEDKDESPKGPTLNKELSKYVEVVTEEGDSGVKYNKPKRKSKDIPKNVKDAINTKISLSDQLLTDLVSKFNKATKEKKKSEYFKAILEAIQNNLVGKSTIEKMEKFFKDNLKYFKPDSGKEGSLPPHDNKTQQSLADSDTSMNGNQHYEYVRSELDESSKMVPITYQKSGEEPVQVWLREQGFNIQELVDNYLGKVVERDAEKDVKDKTPIHYLHTKEQPDVVFLGIEYAKVEDVIPRSVAKKVIEAQDGKTYIIVGSLGWEEERAGTEDMFNTVLDSFDGNEYSSEGWSVNTEHTNRIKDIEAGATVKQTPEDKESDIRDLRFLLMERNPYGLHLGDFSWTVIEGKEDAPERKVINGEASNIYGIKDARPGQVYLNIPASNGKFIPIYMEVMGLTELEETTPLYEEIARLVEIIADRNNSMEDKKAAIDDLNNYLIFAPKLNIIHVNDENYKYAPNTINITKDGVTTTVIDFNDGTGVDAKELLDLVISLNPRINLSTVILDRNPHIYLYSGVLKTDIALLGTVNSRFFVYPIDTDGEYVENKPFKGTGNVYDGSTRRRIYVNGKYVYFDGKKFTDAKGNKIDDPSGVLEDAVQIKRNKIKPTKVNRVDYYIVGNRVYIDNGHGGLNMIEGALAYKILDSVNKKESENKRKRTVKKEATRIKKKEENLEEPETAAVKTDEEEEEHKDGDIVQKVTVKDGVKITKFIKYRKTKSGKVSPITGKSGLLISPSTISKDSLDNIDSYDEIRLAELREKGDKLAGTIFAKNADGLTQFEVVFTTNPLSPSKPSKTTEKSNFSNGTNIDEIKSHDEINSEAENNSFVNEVRKKENRSRLISIITGKFGTKVKTVSDIMNFLKDFKPAIDLSKADVDTVLEILKNCRNT